MQRLNVAGAPAIFVGDGLSDRYAAACASVVFAKDRLAAFCDAASIPYTPYGTLADVARGLERLLEAGSGMPAALSGKAFPHV
jgi:2-hydroxy-3-keto-5-methylthiopentenyl-1-phosphate phosphatase